MKLRGFVKFVFDFVVELANLKADLREAEDNLVKVLAGICFTSHHTAQKASNFEQIF